MAASPVLDFWARQGLKDRDRNECLQLIRAIYPMHVIEEFEEQGYCSYTLLATPGNGSSLGKSAGLNHRIATGLNHDGLIIQLRPAQHALDLHITDAARKTFQILAPKTRALGLFLPGNIHAYEMERLPGMPFSRLQPRHRRLDAEACQKLQRLITSLADLIAQSWLSSCELDLASRDVRADSPVEDTSNMLSKCTGKVGSTIIDRLQKLALQLPDEVLRSGAHSTLKAVRGMANYPLVLTHGDLIPSNILVDAETWEIVGLVDWAEAEFLPFGTCLYGLEHLLGFFTEPLSPSLEPFSHDNDSIEFVYFDDAASMRELFWKRLLYVVPELDSRKAEAKIFRDVGVLLWRGIAWDNGAIDRVVNEVNDMKELACLRTLWNASSGLSDKL